MFVESLDRAFENVCELDLVFHFDDVGLTPLQASSIRRSSNTDSGSRTVSGPPNIIRNDTRRPSVGDKRR